MLEIKLESPGFPEELDVQFYRSDNPDLARFDDTFLRDHYRLHGIREGRSGNRIKTRKDFVSIIPKTAAQLEIGPYYSPIISGPTVKYFDILSRDGMIVRAKNQGIENPNPPHIDYISPNGDLGIVTEQFDFVVSSYCIEHQPDLIKHFIDVQNILKPNGFYFALVPDKRYCHDHFMAESTIAGVLDTNYSKRTTHPLRSVIEHVALSAHNDPFRHWAGDHGEPMENFVARARKSLETYEQHGGKYIDVHSWYFTPDSMRTIISALNELEYCRLKCLRCYETRRGNNDFWIILQKA